MTAHEAELEAWERRYTQRLRDQRDQRQIAAGARHEWSAEEKPPVESVGDDPPPRYEDESQE